MKQYLYKTVFIFILFLISCSDDDSKDEINDFTTQISDKEVAQIIKKNVVNFPNNTQISIAIIDNEKTEYIGIIKKDDVFQIADNKNKIFEIGSITKVFTSILLSDLIRKEQATLSETLQNQFDFTLKNGGDIQLLQLANHTSGLPRITTNYETVDFNPKDPYANYTPELLEAYLENEVVLNNSIGTKFEYSNLGMGLLGYILSEKAEQTYEDFIQKVIFQPLQMTNSTTLLSNVNETQLVSGLDANGNTTSNWNFTNASVGAGGIKSSIIDLEKFTRKNFEDDSVYNLPQTPTYTIDNGLTIGLGWHILNDEGFTILFHTGGTGGYRSILTMDKNNKKAVIVLSNVSAFNVNHEQIDQLCLSLLENISIE